ISVPQKHLSQIAAGQIANVSIPGLDAPDLKGKVLAVIPQASIGSRNFPVLLEMQNPDRRLASGMYAKVSLVLDNGQEVKVIPRTALQYRDQKLVVYRFQPSKDPLLGTVEEISVEIGQELEGEVVVRSVQEPFLMGDDPIVGIGGTKLKDGDQVRVLLPFDASNPLSKL
ncbi:efflux RND transporter periplasmic adaptor subunit, partial [Verrucomicrobia bacterium]|nr:efflux RND transporter periplasmic adaptor subunit [Verrucomicrobiota bacterium]